MSGLLSPVRPSEPGPRPTFSVVIPVWRAAGLRVAVTSVLEQTEPPLQIVVCDDGSPDDVAAALGPLADRVRLVRIEHAGAAAARNAAAAQCHGEFLVLLDADDTWAAERLARLGDLASAVPALDVLTTDAHFLLDGVRRGTFHGAAAFPVRDQRRELLQRNFVFGHAAVRRSAWQSAGGMDTGLRSAEDWDLWLRLVLAGAQVGCVDEPLADYTLHSGSLSADRVASLRSRVQVLDRVASAGLLRPEEVPVLRRARREAAVRAALVSSEGALLTGAPERRRSSARLVVLPGASVRLRFRGALATLMPGVARSRLQRSQPEAGLRHDRRPGGAASGVPPTAPTAAATPPP